MFCIGAGAQMFRRAATPRLQVPFWFVVNYRELFICGCTQDDLVGVVTDFAISKRKEG
jgi:hypothetical protein